MEREREREKTIRYFSVSSISAHNCVECLTVASLSLTEQKLRTICQYMSKGVHGALNGRPCVECGRPHHCVCRRIYFSKVFISIYMYFLFDHNGIRGAAIEYEDSILIRYSLPYIKNRFLVKTVRYVPIPADCADFRGQVKPLIYDRYCFVRNLELP